MISIEQIISNPSSILLYGVGIVVLVALVCAAGTMGNKMNKELAAEREQREREEDEAKQSRMQTVTVEDTKAVEDTVNKSGIGIGTVLMDGHVGVGTSLGEDRNETVINHYAYLRNKANCLMQFSVSADEYAAISYLKGKEITVEMLPDCCIWQDRIKLKNKFIIEDGVEL